MHPGGGGGGGGGGEGGGGGGGGGAVVPTVTVCVTVGIVYVTVLHFEAETRGTGPMLVCVVPRWMKTVWAGEVTVAQAETVPVVSPTAKV